MKTKHTQTKRDYPQSLGIRGFKYLENIIVYLQPYSEPHTIKSMLTLRTKYILYRTLISVV
jgi:hypothetical protein